MSDIIKFTDTNIYNDSLVINITFDCNLHCPWCVEENTNKCKYSIIPPYIFDLLLLHIKNNQYKNYCLMGGEPLLYPNYAISIIDNILDIQPDAKFSVFTNGTTLNENLVNVLNDRNVYVTISLEAEGYKGIKNLIKNANNSKNIIDDINRLKYKNIRIIGTRDRIVDINFIYDILMLRTIFPDITIEISLDYNELSLYTIDDIKKYNKNMNILKNKYCIDDKIVIMQSFMHKCTRTSNRFMLGENVIYTKCDYNIKRNYGCWMLRNAMSDDVFNEYTKMNNIFEVEI